MGSGVGTIHRPDQTVGGWGGLKEDGGITAPGDPFAIESIRNRHSSRRQAARQMPR
jgi:hypothetical protein